MKWLLGLCFLALSVLQTTPAAANQRVSFDFMPRGAMANAIITAWKREYADFYKDMGLVPDFALAQYDLNGDGRPEIFALHTDDLSGYCDTAEVGKDMCLLLVYANTERGLIKIGEIPVGGEVVVSTRVSKGVRDLIISQPDKTRKTYIWNGRGYEAQ